MGLLTTGGPPMRWGTPECEKAIPYVREHGIIQFINLWMRYSPLQECPFLWGDEVEGLIVDLSDRDDTVRLSLTAASLIEQANASQSDSKFLPEFGSFMVESTPLNPYNASKTSILSVEGTMQRRSDLLRSLLSKPGDTRTVVMLVAFPLMGTMDFVRSATPLCTQGEYCESIFVPDEIANTTHPRFLNLARNIRLRRGRKVCIQVPLYLDSDTEQRSVDSLYRIDKHPANTLIDCAPLTNAKTVGFDDVDDDDDVAPSSTTTTGQEEDSHAFTHLYTPATHYYYGQYHPTPDRAEIVEARYEACPCPIPSVTHPCVYMDAMAFGMGMCCLQVTMQLPDVSVARHIFDQLTAISPIFLAITAATPVMKGHLVDSDVRWLTIAASVDDRKRSEVPRILKSRYDSVSLFISNRPESLEPFNDSHVEVNAAVLDRLKAAGIDERLARHVSHLFIRDPLVMYQGRIEEVDDEHCADHFENIQSTNWQTVRFKPPPFDSGIGWRVEFRIMEIQMTAFENAAFSVFVVLLTRAILKYDLWFYIPMSKVDENMGRAHMRDAIINQRFWFPKTTAATASASERTPVELTANEIFNGCSVFEGYVPLVRRFVHEDNIGDSRIDQYLRFVSLRAAGTLQTTAAFLREFVVAHRDYQHDSRVSPRIARDMVELARDMSRGLLSFASFLPAELTAVQGPSPRKRPHRDDEEN